MPINSKYIEEVLNQFFGCDGYTFIVTPKDTADQATSGAEKTTPQKETPSGSK